MPRLLGRYFFVWNEYNVTFAQIISDFFLPLWIKQKSSAKRRIPRLFSARFSWIMAIWFYCRRSQLTIFSSFRSSFGVSQDFRVVRRFFKSWRHKAFHHHDSHKSSWPEKWATGTWEELARHVKRRKSAASSDEKRRLLLRSMTRQWPNKFTTKVR